jgi:hypothetical protein
MIFNTVRTIYNIKLQSANLMGKQYHPLPNTTLNEKFIIYPNYGIDGKNPNLSLYTIGIGGSPIIDNTAINLKRGLHKPIDGSLFEHIPFVLREIGNDLDDDTRKKYRLRKNINVNGYDYIAYYAKVIDEVKYEDTIYKVNSRLENNFIGPYDTLSNPKILHPEPVSNLDLLNVKGDYILNECKIILRFTKEEVEELNNAISILYPDKDNIIISEIGLCSGINVGVPYGTESVWTQINYFVDSGIDTKVLYNNLSNKDFELMLDIGGMEPLYIGATDV